MAVALPLLLCGPVIRRVEARSVSIWVALSEQSQVTVDLFTDIVNIGTGPTPVAPPRPPFASATAATKRIGEKLHIALVTVTLDQAAGKMPLGAGLLFSYNVTISHGGTTSDLRSLGLLQDTGVAGGGSDGNAPISDEPLGYENGRLPGFATVPAKLEDLHFAHASCSKLHGLGGDSLLAQVDDLVKDNRNNALPPDASHPSRPHQLFLTGDQIYADDVATTLSPALTLLGQTLLGTAASEKIFITVDGSEQKLDATQQNFPAGRRQYLMSSAAKFTSEDAASHLLSFGEFAALYLLGWSPAAWPRAAKNLLLGTMAPWTKPADGADDRAAWDQNDKWRAGFPANDPELKSRTVLDPAVASPIEKQLTPFFSAAPPAGPEANWTSLQKAAYHGLIKARNDFVDDRKRIEDIAKSIWKIRRALANIPTYMILDDHEVTDDWYLTQRWKTNALGSSLGKSVIRNAMTAYVLFQGWGNDPAAFTDPASAGGAFLSAATSMFPAAGGEWPQTDAVRNLDTCFGLSMGDPAMRFDYVVDGNAHRVIVMDSRTRREYDGLDTPPALLSKNAIRDQIQRGPFPNPLPAGIELLVIVSPAPMVGPPLFEEALMPLAVRGFDAWWVALKSSDAQSVEQAMTGIDRSKPTGAQYFDAEGWSNNPRALEAMFTTLAGYNAPVLILAGDVHYASSFAIDYAPAGKPAVRFVHLTSSAAKNAWPDAVCSVMSSISWGRSLTIALSPARHFGWTDSSPSPLDDVSGEFPPLIGRVKRHPVLLPEHGWRHHHNFTRAPDWRWQLTELTDTRKDADRPLKAQPQALPPGDVSDAMHPAAGTLGYGDLTHAHVSSMDLMFLRRGTVFANNYGHVSFSRDANGLSVSHELHSIRPHPDPGEDDEGYTLHASSFKPAIEPVEAGIG